MQTVTKGLKGNADFLFSRRVKLANQNIDSYVTGPVQLIIDADYYDRVFHKVAKKFGFQVL